MDSFKCEKVYKACQVNWKLLKIQPCCKCLLHSFQKYKFKVFFISNPLLISHIKFSKTFFFIQYIINLNLTICSYFHCICEWKPGTYFFVCALYMLFKSKSQCTKFEIKVMGFWSRILGTTFSQNEHELNIWYWVWQCIWLYNCQLWNTGTCWSLLK